MRLLVSAKSRVHPWIRLNRVVRDIPSQYVLGGVDAPNLRQDVLVRMAERGVPARRRAQSETQRIRDCPRNLSASKTLGEACENASELGIL